MTKYVVGFAFWRNYVLLIHKKKGPKYVINTWNGIGGKIEGKELPQEAMAREFQEETGIITHAWEWRHFTTMSGNSAEGNDYELNCLVTHLPPLTEFGNAVNTEENGEIIEWKALDDLGSVGITPNLSWLLPLGLDHTTPYLSIQEAVLKDGYV